MHTCIDTYTHTHAYIHTYTETYIHIHIFIHAYIHTYIQTHTHAHRYFYTPTDKHTHTHTHTHTQRRYTQLHKLHAFLQKFDKKIKIRVLINGARQTFPGKKHRTRPGAVKIPGHCKQAMQTSLVTDPTLSDV
jgi:hypothetical protein